MFSISINYGPAGTVWNFLYKTEESAKAAMEKIGDKCLIVDDFGQSANIQPAQIHGMLFEDLDQSQFGQIERGIHHARSQARAQERGMADPVIGQSLRRQQGGPAVMTPFGPNGRFNG